MRKRCEEQTDLWECPWKFIHDLFLLLRCQYATSSVHSLYELLQWILYIWISSVEMQSLRLEQILLFSSSRSYAHASCEVRHMQRIKHGDQPAHHTHNTLAAVAQHGTVIVDKAIIHLQIGGRKMRGISHLQTRTAQDSHNTLVPT